MKSTKQHILSTRPLHSDIVNEANANNIFIDEVAFIKTLSIADEPLKSEIGKLANKEMTAVFTSMTSVEIIAEISKKVQWNIYCIGNTTKQLIEKSFPGAQIISFAKNASQLADIIIANNEKEVVFFCGDIRREELPDKLQKAGIDVNEMVVYKTIETPVLLDKVYDGIMFFSPSAVRSFFGVNKVSGGPVFFAIGNTTATEIKKYSKNDIIITDEPGKEELVKQVINYYQKLAIK